MAQEVPVSVLQGNDRTLEFDLTSADPSFSLAGKRMEFRLKRYKSDNDTIAMVTLTSEDAAQVNIVDPAALVVQVHLTGLHLAEAGMKFYRLDVVDPNPTPVLRNTAMYGPFDIVDV